MQKKLIIVILVAVAVIALVATYPTKGARAFAVTSLNEASIHEMHYGALLSYAEDKRDWVEAEMAGEEGYLQTEALRIEVKGLKRIYNECAQSFNTRYTIFSKLGLI